MSTKYAATFLILAAGSSLAAATTAHPAARAAGLCSALAAGLVAAAYGFAGPKLLLKHPRGHRRAWAWPLYWPYFLMNGLGLTLFRLVEKRPPFAEVAPGLFLGRRLTAREARRPGMPAWHAVLDLAAEFSEARPLRELAGYRSMPVLDATAPSPGELADAVVWLSGHLTRGPVYLHCALGHGRSATVAVAYLLATGRASTVADGLASVRSRRPGVGLNPPQEEALQRFIRDAGENGCPLPRCGDSGSG